MNNNNSSLFNTKNLSKFEASSLFDNSQDKKLFACNREGVGPFGKEDHDEDRISDISGEFSELFGEEDKEFDNLSEINNEDDYDFDIDDSLAGDVNTTIGTSIENIINVPFVFADEYMNKTIRGIFTKQIQSFGERLLDCKSKKIEIENFIHYLSKFELSIDNNKFVRFAFIQYEKLKEDKNNKSLNLYRNNKGSNLSIIFLIHDNSINFFNLKFTDLYINMIVKDRKLLKDSLELLGDYLRKATKGYVQEYSHEEKQSRNKVVFRFPDGTFDFIIKTNINLHQRKDQLIYTYAQLDERFAIMGSFLCYWAHLRGIYNERYLNLHAFYLMIIYFLMTLKPAILPNIYNPKLNNYIRMKRKGLKIQGKDQYYSSEFVLDLNYEENYIDIKEKMLKQEQNKMTVGELVTRFFYAFAFDIPNSGKSISIKYGKLIQQRFPIYGYSVADPFTDDYELCRTLKRTSKEFIVVQEEFQRAFKCIQENKIKDLLTKFKG